MAVESGTFAQFCDCMNKAEQAAVRKDLETMKCFFKKAETYPAVVPFQKWMLECIRSLYLLLFDKEADEDAVVRELLRLRKEAVYKPQTAQDYENSIYRYIKDTYVKTLVLLIERYCDKADTLPEYEELCMELIEIMEEEQWELLNPKKDYYSYIYGMTANYYAKMGRPIIAGSYFQKVWERCKDEEYITNTGFTLLCDFIKNLFIQGRMEDAKDVIFFLWDRMFDEKVVVIEGGSDMERITQQIFYHMAIFLKQSDKPELTLDWLNFALNSKKFRCRRWNAYTLDLYSAFLLELDEKNLPISLKKKIEIQHYLNQYEKKVDQAKTPAWKVLEYHITKYLFLKLKKNRKAAACLDECRTVLLEEKFEERDRVPFLHGAAFVAKEYAKHGRQSQAFACAEFFMKKNVEFYAAAEFYMDNENMEKYLEICDLAFQFLYQAASSFAFEEKKFEYSLNYKNIISSAIRLRNEMHAMEESELARREKKAGALHYFTLQDLGEVLPEHTAVLDFLYLEPEIYEEGKRTWMSEHPRKYYLDIFAAVKKDGICTVKYKSIDEAGGLNGLVEDLIEKMRTDAGNVKKLSAVVYGELIQEFEQGLQNIRHLWVCPDGILCNLSFDTLFELSGNSFDLRSIVYWQSLRDIFEVWQGIGTESLTSSCMIGNPVFGLNAKRNTAPGSEGRHWAATQLVPLPYSGYEAKKMSMLMDGESFTDEKATKYVLRHGYRYVHIATHGFNQSVSKHAWHDSVLAFSGSQDYLESGQDTQGYGNGFLSAEEISRMDLKGTELAVLSACGSGSSVFSLRLQQTGLHIAFGIAGVKYIISALWEVDDFATAVFMSLFYEYLKKNTPVEEALFQAKVQMRHFTAGELAALVRQDRGLLQEFCDELLAAFERMPPGYCCYSSMRYWGSFICNRTMF